MIEPQAIYHPLYTDTDKFIILITGGRGSGKSFNASTFIERLTFEMTEAEKIVHQVLYIRWYVYHSRNDGEDRARRNN